jgi:hypothetical protein
VKEVGPFTVTSCPSPKACTLAPTGRVAQWSWRSALVPKVLGFEPDLFHKACGMPLHGR